MHPDHRRKSSVLGVVLAIVALALRLAWPTPVALPAASGAELALLLGPHALCLGGARSDQSAPGPYNRHSGDQNCHDCAGCCAAAVAGGFIKPEGAALTRVVFAIRVPLYQAAAVPRAATTTRTAQARAPPVSI